MKKRIVLWGTDKEDKKILLGLELQEEENNILLHTIPQEKATEDFYKSMMNVWREGNDVAMPEGHATMVRPLSMTDDILPEDIKVERTDIINRAKTEWHFVVLSSKLYALYKTELEDIKTKVEGLTKFEGSVWEEMKGFWAKVQDQARERNLFREHANELKKETNDIFERLKKLRKTLDQEFKKLSSEHLDTFMTKLNDVQEKVDKGLGLKPLFEELKSLQAEFKGIDFTKDDRSKAWKKLDGTFKNLKEKKYGKSGGGREESGLQRVERRYNGLLNAIQKMERSINKDKSELDFQDKRAAQSEGQLEQQIRQAKMAMMQSRVVSKEEKLQDMLKTKTELEGRIEQEKIRDQKKQERKEIEETKKKVKEKIANEIKAKSESHDKEKLEKSATAIKGKPQTKLPPVELPKDEPVKKEAPVVEAPTSETSAAESSVPEAKQGLIGAIAATVGEAMEEVVDTVKAVVEVVEDKIEDTVQSLTEEE